MYTILGMSDSKRNGQLGFIQNILQQRVPNLPVRVLKYKCQMQLKMHSDRSGSQNLEFRVLEVLWSCGFMASLHFFQQNK